MTLSPGDRVGVYEIEGLLAAGGMSEVYVGHDRRMGRRVAVKMLPAAFGDDNSRLARFEQEIRATSQLAHPNIVSVFDVGKHGSLPYLVTELLEGETLRSTLDRGRMPLHKAVDFAGQIAIGLAAAHARGIAHRDLKPANVFVMRDGHVKLLDFGLAKVAHPEWERSSREDETVSSTSLEGKVFGSVGYMAPEQVQGKPTDFRADIFAFGAIVYEMLSGCRAFSGASAVETMHAILRDDPPELAEVAPHVFPPMAAVVHRCLAKEPHNRFQSIDDALFALLAASTTLVERRGRTLTSARLFTGIVVALLATGLLAALWLLVRKETPPDDPNGWLHDRRTTRSLIASREIRGATLSPDGRFITYLKKDGTLWTRHLPSGQEIRIGQAAEGYGTGSLRYSADGNHVVYTEGFGEQSIYRMGLLGGKAERVGTGLRSFRDFTHAAIDVSRDGTLAHLSTGGAVFVTRRGSPPRKIVNLPERTLADLAWSPDGKVLVAAGLGRGLLEIEPQTGRKRWFSVDADLPARAVRWLPDGRSLVILVDVDDATKLYRVQYPSGERRFITDEAAQVRFGGVSTEGIAVQRVDRAMHLYRVPIGSDRDAVQITANRVPFNGRWGLDWTSTGRIVFSREQQGYQRIYTSDSAGGTVQPLIGDAPSTVDDRALACSPDGNYICFRRGVELRGDLWCVRADGTAPRQLTFHGSVTSEPSFTPDSTSVAFTVAQKGKAPQVWLASLSGGPPRLLAGGATCHLAGLSPDGQKLACFGDDGYVVLDADDGRQLWNSRRIPMYPLRWTTDGSAVAWIEDDHVVAQSIVTNRVTRLAACPARAFNFRFSPHGDEVVIAGAPQNFDLVLISPTNALERQALAR